MSTAGQIIADQVTDTAPSIARKRRQTPYKPRLATAVKATLEESVNEAIEAQRVMSEILAWLDEERMLRDDLRGQISKLAPLDHRMQALLRQETETLLRIGRLENRIARLAILITGMERRLTSALIFSRPAAVPPRERRNSGEI